MKHVPAFALAFLIATSGLSASESVHEVRALNASGTVQIELVSGSLRLIGWDEPRVEVSGTLTSGSDRLEIEGENDRVTIHVSPGEDSHEAMGNADLEIHLPAGCSVEVEAVSASITTVNLAGRVDLESVSGEIEIGGNPREAQVSTVSGAISVEGEARMEQGAFETVSGKIEAKLGLHPSARLEFETVSGSIELHIPAQAAADILAETFSGTIENELGPEAEEKEAFLPAKKLSFSLGGGGARISLSSFSGAIRIRKS